jgi:hypothetical protein
MAAASAGVAIAADMGTDGPASMDRPTSTVSALTYPMAAALASMVALASRVAAASMAVVLVVASTAVAEGAAAIVKKQDCM